MRKSVIGGLSLVLAVGAISVPLLASTSSATFATNALGGASCSSAKACLAVGYYSNSVGLKTLAEAWNGTAWRILTTPNPAGATDSELAGVSCSSAKACIAVGNNGYKTLAEAWNGTKWRILATPNPTLLGGRFGGLDMDLLTGVSAVSATDAWAVGGRSTSSGRIGDTLIEHWNGKRWSVVASPNPVGFTPANTAFNVLSGVSCSSAKACIAVGNWGTSLSHLKPLAEVWNGTSWRIMTTPSPAARGGDLLNGVSMLSPKDAWAVGGRGLVVGTTTSTLIEHWNGHRWAVTTSPNPLVAGNGLSGVVAVSARNIWAVGTIGLNNRVQPLAVHWNGTGWTRVSTPKPKGYNSLAGVARIPGTPGLWAVGATTLPEPPPSSVTVPLVEHWSVTGWTVTPTPAMPGG